jgi:hypothetical protein
MAKGRAVEEPPVRVGSMLFTMVDPVPGHEVAYNRWYERDHFYTGCMVGAWWFAGTRWAAPRALKNLRFPADSKFAEPVDAGSFLSIYWVHEGHEQEAFDWSGEQFRWIYMNDRGFNERKHAHTALYDLASTRYAADDPIPLALALDHRYPGLAVLSLDPAEGHTRDELREWLDDGPVQGLLGTEGVETVCSWTVRGADRAAAPAPAPDPNGKVPSLATEGGRPDRLVQMCFIEGDPAGCWDAFRGYAKEVADGGIGTVTFAAPFWKTVVGTDTYTDQLW